MRFEITPQEYFAHGYNNTLQNERCIEIPLAIRYLQEHDLNNVIEVGAVTPYYFEVPYPVIDIADQKATHIQDACDIDYKDKDVLSISTLEHIDEVQDSKHSSIELLKRILSESKSCLLTIPMGYNKSLDDFILTSINYHAYKKITQHLWEYKNPIMPCLYGSPFMFANGLLVLHKG